MFTEFFAEAQINSVPSVQESGNPVVKIEDSVVKILSVSDILCILKICQAVLFLQGASRIIHLQ
jgi:hypothetical protein